MKSIAFALTRALSLLMVVGCVVLGPAAAQQQPPAAPAAAAISQPKLEAFVDAAIKIDGLAREYMPKINEAKTKEEAEKVRKEASDKMVAAIQATPGIEVQEYREIAQTAMGDPNLQQRIEQILAQKAPPAGAK